MDELVGCHCTHSRAINSAIHRKRYQAASSPLKSGVPTKVYLRIQWYHLVVPTFRTGTRITVQYMSFLLTLHYEGKSVIQHMEATENYCSYLHGINSVPLHLLLSGFSFIGDAVIWNISFNPPT